MLSESTHIRPSPLLACSAARQSYIPFSGPVLHRRVGFTRTDLSCRLSHRHETFPQKIITTNRERISPPKTKQLEADGLAAGTGEDEETGLSQEEKKKSIELMEGLSEEEKKKIFEVVEGLSEEQQRKITEILMGFSEEEKRINSEFLEERNRIIGEFVEGLSEEGIRKNIEFFEGLSEEGWRKTVAFLNDLSEVEKRKASEFVERLSEEEKKQISKLVEDLSIQGMKNITELVLERVEGKKHSKLIIEDMSVEDVIKIQKFLESVNYLTKVKFFLLAVRLGKEKKVLELMEIFKLRIERHVVGALSKEENKKRVKFFNAKISKFVEALREETNMKIMELTEGFKEEKKKINERVKGWSKKDKTKVTQFEGGLSEKNKKYDIDLLQSLREEAKRIEKLADLLKGMNEIDKELIKKVGLDLLPRFEFFKKVFGTLGFELLLGSVVYATMKMSPTMAGDFHFFSIFLTDGLLLPTCRSLKDILSNQKDKFLNGLCIVLFSALGVLLADAHLAHSNGIVMLAALIPTLAMFVLLVLGAVLKVAVKREDLSCFGSSNYSILLTISSLMLIFIRGPIATAVDTGLTAFVFCMFIVNDTWMILKHSGDEDHAMAAHLFWDLYGLFICSIKLLSPLFGRSIS